VQPPQPDLQDLPDLPDLTDDELSSRETLVRARALWLMRLLIAEADRVHYPPGDRRTMTISGIATRGDLERALDSGLTVDCSQMVTLIAHVAGARDPNGGRFAADGYTGTLLDGSAHIPRDRAKCADLRVFGGGTGHHVAMVMTPGPDPLLFSHGAENGPVAILESRELRLQPPGGTFLQLPVQ
jgi:hypothetical protein